MTLSRTAHIPTPAFGSPKSGVAMSATAPAS